MILVECMLNRRNFLIGSAGMAGGLYAPGTLRGSYHQLSHGATESRIISDKRICRE
jgi:hypothetical protein